MQVQSSDIPNEGPLDERVHAGLQTAIFREHIPGAALAVWQRGRLISASAGQANVEARIDVDVDTIFQIGSITKVFTATLLMALAEDGRISLDAPVHRYLPDFRIAGSTPPDSLTVRTLLDHSSGIAGDCFDDFGPGPEALALYVDGCARLPLLFQPGTMRGYSSTAYCVAGRIVEVVTGLPFEQALTERLLRPLGMQRFAFFTHDIARYRTAIGHVVGEGGYTPASALRLPHSLAASGASLSTTAHDLLRFGLMHLRGGVGEDGQAILSAAACTAMVGPSRHVLPNDSPLRIGWASVPLGEGEMICASGETVHQNAFLAFSGEHQLVLAILANSSGGATRLFMSLGCDLVEAMTGARPRTPKLQPAAPVTGLPLAPYAGEYTNHTRLSATARDGLLAVAITAKDPSSPAMLRQEFLLTPIGDHRFVAGPPEQPAALFEFLFTDGPAQASHIATAGRIFARSDADGRTRWR